MAKREAKRRGAPIVKTSIRAQWKGPSPTDRMWSKQAVARWWGRKTDRKGVAPDYPCDMVHRFGDLIRGWAGLGAGYRRNVALLIDVLATLATRRFAHRYKWRDYRICGNYARNRLLGAHTKCDAKQRAGHIANIYKRNRTGAAQVRLHRARRCAPPIQHLETSPNLLPCRAGSFPCAEERPYNPPNRKAVGPPLSGGRNLFNNWESF